MVCAGGWQHGQLSKPPSLSPVVLFPVIPPSRPQGCFGGKLSVHIQPQDLLPTANSCECVSLGWLMPVMYLLSRAMAGCGVSLALLCSVHSSVRDHLASPWPSNCFAASKPCWYRRTLLAPAWRMLCSTLSLNWITAGCPSAVVICLGLRPAFAMEA